MLADFHNDVLTSKNKENLLRKYNNDRNEIVCAYFKGNGTFADAFETCKLFTKYKQDNLYLAFEDFSYTKNLNVLKTLLDFKPVYVSLTWNDENFFGGGAHSTGRLKKLGKDLIKLLNERKIALDLAHANEQTFYDALEFADKPICSHACIYDVTENRRNLKSGQIAALVEKNGLFGLTFYKPFLTQKETADVDDVIKHIDYFCERFPHKNLCIGTDLNGCEAFPTGFEDYSFEPLLREALSTRGYKQEIIDDVLYSNLNEFLNDSVETAKPLRP